MKAVPSGVVGRTAINYHGFCAGAPEELLVASGFSGKGFALYGALQRHWLCALSPEETCSAIPPFAGAARSQAWCHKAAGFFALPFCGAMCMFVWSCGLPSRRVRPRAMIPMIHAPRSKSYPTRAPTGGALGTTRTFPSRAIVGNRHVRGCAYGLLLCRAAGHARPSVPGGGRGGVGGTFCRRCAMARVAGETRAARRVVARVICDDGGRAEAAALVGALLRCPSPCQSPRRRATLRRFVSICGWACGRSSACARR